jgi:hypothetical protein
MFMDAEQVVAAYREMANDEERERDAREWSEGVISDVLGDRRDAAGLGLVGRFRPFGGRRNPKDPSGSDCQ